MKTQGKNITLEEIARAAGVSTATVSRALYSTYPVKESTKAKIRRIADELNYRPNVIARGLRTERTGTIGIVCDDIASPFTPRIIRGIQDYLHQRGYVSVIINSDRRPDAELAALHDLLSRSIDGVMLVESYLRGGNLPLDIAEKPYIFVHRLFGRVSEANTVMVDDPYGARLAVEHLLSLGHSRIAHIIGPEGWGASTDRLEGYKRVLDEHDIEFDPMLVAQSVDWSVDGGYKAMHELLARSVRPTAVFAANDPIALGVIYAARDYGLTVPNDLSVVGYDDQLLASQLRPSLTTVALPCYEMGQAATRILIDELDGHASPEAPLKVQGTLIERGSCGPNGSHNDPLPAIPLDN